MELKQWVADMCSATKNSEDDLMHYLKMSSTGFKAMMDRGDLKLSVYKKIREFFKLPKMSFFDAMMMGFHDDKLPEPNTLHEPDVRYGADFRDKYYKCVEEKNDLLKQIIELQKEPAAVKAKSGKLST